MKVMFGLKNGIMTFALCLSTIVMLFIAGCGSGDSTAPSGSSITFIPSSYSSLTLAGNTCFPISILIRDSKSNLLNGISFTIYGPFAAPRLPTRYEIWRYPGCSNTAGNVMVNGTLGLTETTGSDGTYAFSLNIYSSATATFSDSLQAIAGTASASLEISVQ